MPKPVTFGVPSVAVRPADGLAERLTAPEKPFWAVTVIVDVPEAPIITGPMEAGLALMVKSLKLKVAVAVWEPELPVPVTVTV